MIYGIIITNIIKMTKLHFHYGTVSSAKTANLIMMAHNYKTKNKQVLLIKPFIDDRYGTEFIGSRAGLKIKADIILKEQDQLFRNEMERYAFYNHIDIILVDEVQFLSINQIEQLKKLSKNIHVYCFGLKTNYKIELFQASKRLFEIADYLKEIETICNTCDAKAIINAKHLNNKIIIDDTTSDIDIGGDEKYMSLCWSCFDNNFQ
jgi:thymidine kinase